MIGERKTYFSEFLSKLNPFLFEKPKFKKYYEKIMNIMKLNL